MIEMSNSMVILQLLPSGTIDSKVKMKAYVE